MLGRLYFSTMDEFIIGLEPFLEDLEELPLLIQRRLVVKALRAASESMQERMSELAPDDPTTPGSQIRENIGINVTEATATGAASYIGPTRAGFIAGFHELGTAFMMERPFIGPAFEETIEEAIELVSEILGEGIEKALKKAKKT